MNTYHDEILRSIEATSKTSQKPYHDGQSYCGTNDFFYDLTTAEKRAITKEFKKKYPEITFAEFILVLDSLNESGSYEEKTLASMLLSVYPNHLAHITPKHVEKWLKNLEGWAEIDTLCQSNFGATQILNDWNVWESALEQFSQSTHITQRRASLVLLTKPVREATDERLKGLAFRNIELLKSEKDILITKAISWLLRSMVKHYRREVSTYLDVCAATLPAIALRETRRKLETGRK